MHFHLPKPLHGWREFLGEVGIIVVGVLVALSAEQVVETMRWHEKVGIARESVRLELESLLAQAEEARQLGSCTGPWLDAAERAIQRHDAAALQILYDGHPPFEPRNWRSTAWQTVMSTQVADHIDKDELNRSAFVFTSIEDLRLMLPPLIDERGEILSGRVGGAWNVEAERAQLAAAERMRTQLSLFVDIAETVQRQARQHVRQTAAQQREVADNLASCRRAATAANSRRS